MAPTPPSPEGVIKVFVRKGPDDMTRIIGFNRVNSGLHQRALMESGWALDGNQAIIIVNVKQLLEQELALQTMFGKLGKDVEFA